MNLLKSNISLFLLLFFCFGNTIDTFSQTSLFSYEKHVNTAGDSLPYRQLISDYDTNSKYPLVIFLHGAGERGNDNEAQLKWGVMNFASSQVMKMHRPIVIAPQCPKGQKWANYSYDNVSFQSSPTKPMKLLLELIQQTIKKYPVDTNRIYITGLSMGGFGTFDAITRNPDLFAAAIPVCGGGDTSKAKVISEIPLWIFHGALDSTINPMLSQKMVAALTKVGANPGFTQYPEVGHFSWIAAYSDTMMIDWLFRQQK